MAPSVSLLLLSAIVGAAEAAIDRQTVVQSFNPRRNASSSTTPLQVGNGNFAFGVDITGLQTFAPFASMSTWGWHNFSLPTTPNQTDPSDFTGLDWMTHGRLVNYDQPNPAENDISNWLIQNPQRINMGIIGFAFPGAETPVTESMLSNKSQELDLWSGGITSSFVYNGSTVDVETWVSPDDSIVGIHVISDLLNSTGLGIFIDFPLPTLDKFSAPFVGVLNQTSFHNTTEGNSNSQVSVVHQMGDTSYELNLQFDIPAVVTKPVDGSHRYQMTFPRNTEVYITATFTTQTTGYSPTFGDISGSASDWWGNYWTSGAFIDLTAESNPNATELQRRIILSQYLLAVNSASDLPPQESGLVNNGWYGKFHLEMYLWHVLHFARWNHWDLLERSTPHTYSDFMQSSFDRAAAQGYKGARWGKMTDPTGRSAPGEINSLLIWQQPHPMHFAEVEYHAFSTNATLAKWDALLEATADFMASYAWFNASSGHYDLGPPMYPVSENTNPNATRNPTFELAYWRFGLDVAVAWKQRQNKTAPAAWTDVLAKLAPLPVVDGTFPIYEGVPGMWTDPATTNNHPAITGIYGFLPPPVSGPPLNLTVVQNTADRVRETWDLSQSYGWDFPMLAMNSLRLGDAAGAVDYLLHPYFQFDDAGYPVGGVQVPTPYFPGASSLLLAVAMMAGGWDGAEGPHFPAGWNVTVEGFVPGL